MLRASLLALALLSACEREPTFDERYEQTSERLSRQAKEIDAELDREPEKNATSPTQLDRATR